MQIKCFLQIVWFGKDIDPAKSEQQPTNIIWFHEI